MTLAGSLAAIAGAAAVCFLLAAAGKQLLRVIGIATPAEETLLYSLACGVVAMELAVTLAQCFAPAAITVRFATATLCAVGLLGGRSTFRDTLTCAQKIAKLPSAEKALAACVGIVLFAQCLAAVAPLTGSDALHYHFTVPALLLRQGFHPNWFLPHSFFLGQNHALIVTGLAWGSERFALALIALGGAAASAALIVLARRLLAGTLSWVAALVFLLTPVVFWQITASGSPDMWTAFFLPLGVLAIVEAAKHRTAAHFALAGMLCGAVAGGKYTGIVFAAMLFSAFLMELRSLRGAMLFVTASLFAGIWPYLRNFVWTGDPIFPFFLGKCAPEQMNSYAMASYISDTHYLGSHSIGQILKFPLFAVIASNEASPWEFLGPLVLVLVVLVGFAFRNTPLWRSSLVVWIGGSIALGLASSMPRFTLPVLPVAIAAGFAGLGTLARSQFRWAWRIAAASVTAFLLFGFASMLFYERSAWAEVSGRLSEKEYLERRGPDFRRAEFISEKLSGASKQGAGEQSRVMVFFRHVYYLKVPFVYGNAEESWPLDPEKMKDESVLEGVLRRENVRWVARAPAYPVALQQSFLRLEARHVLEPCISGEVEDFNGNRFAGTPQRISITILCVQPPQTSRSMQ